MDNIELSRATLDDIVFENRNKSYGAFLLRKLYDKNILTALGIAVAIFSLALAMPVIIKLFAPEEVSIVVDDIPDVVTVVDVPINKDAPPPPPIEDVPPPELKTIKFVPPEPAPDPEVDEPPPPPQEKLNTQNISNKTKDGKDTIADVPVVPIGPIGDLGVGTKDDFWMGSVSKEVTFPGGIQKYIANHLPQKVYSYIQDRNIKGRVFVSFEISKTGEIIKAYIPAGRELVDCKICNEEIVKIIQSMPPWEPAENNGNPVSRKITIPIVFK